MAEEGGSFGASCPQCDAPITGETDSCSECGLQFLDGGEELSDDAIQAMLDNAGVAAGGSAGPGRIGAPATVRLFVGLAITAPLAPIVLFVTLAITPLPIWVSVILLTAAWAVPGYLLARPRVPTQIVANGLLAVGIVMASTPVLIPAGRALLGTAAADIGSLGANVAGARTVFLALGVVVVAVGGLVRRHALSTRARWDRETIEGQE